MKLVSSNEYDTKISDWDMNCIKEIKIEYGKLSIVIVDQQKLLQSKRSNKSQVQSS